MLTWAHIGDLHISHEDEYIGADRLAEWAGQARRYLRGGVDFIFLPGDNANNGTAVQYARIAQALDAVDIPMHAIPGDHDFEPGHLESFSNMPGAAALPYAMRVDGRRCLFLDVVSAGDGGPHFRLGDAQMSWLENELRAARSDGARPAIFMHAYPGDLEHEGKALGELFARERVAFVDTGHTHYNEVLNDGHVIYASTRSTAQVEEDEGRAGFSIAALDGDFVSWRFKTLESTWPFVMITAPSDRRLATSPSAATHVRAKVFGENIVSVLLAIEGDAPQPMTRDERDPSIWAAALPSRYNDTGVALSVTAVDAEGARDTDRIEWGGAAYRPEAVADAVFGTDAHAVEPWPEHGVLGTQLGPNKHGRKW